MNKTTKLQIFLGTALVVLHISVIALSVAALISSQNKSPLILIAIAVMCMIGIVGRLEKIIYDSCKDDSIDYKDRYHYND